MALAGLDVIAPDGTPLAPPLRLREDGTYILRIHARPAEYPGTRPLILSAALDSGGPVRETTTPVTANPDGARMQTLELPLRLEPAQGSGESVLRISAARVGAAPSGGIQSWPLAVLPAFVVPMAARCTLDPRRVAEVYGNNAVLLDARFRLGKGASLEFPVPSTLSGVPVRAVGIVSSVAWLPRQDRNRSDLVVATVTVTAPIGEESFPLRLGVETLQVDHEAFAKNRALETGRVNVFSEWTQGEADKMRIRRNYAASCTLNSPRELKSITVRHAGDTAVVQVDGILLLP